jgi:ribonuclease HI
MKKKYYAYAVNGSKGVTESWDECKEIVSGVQGAKFKSFESLEDAELWLEAGADYKVKHVGLKEGIYFDAGTGAGKGVEVSVTNEKGENLLIKISSENGINLNERGKQLLRGGTNNFGELLACKYALQIALKMGVKEVFGDSKLVIDYWSKGYIKKELPKETINLALEVKKLRYEFEKSGGKIEQVSGGRNPADLGFHRG